MSDKIRVYTKNAPSLESLQEMQATRDCLEDEADEIAEQIRAAEAVYHKTRVFADPDWYCSAKNALKIKRKMKARLDRTISLHRKSESEKKSATFERFFIEEARNMLSTEEFDSIIESTKRRTDVSQL